MEKSYWHKPLAVVLLVILLCSFGTDIVLASAGPIAVAETDMLFCRITWQQVQNALKYIVYRDGVKLAETTQLTYQDTTVSSGTTYIYEISYVDTNGESLKGPEITYTHPVNYAAATMGGSWSADSYFSDAETPAAAFDESMATHWTAVWGGDAIYRTLAEPQNIKSIILDFRATNVGTRAKVYYKNELGEWVLIEEATGQCPCIVPIWCNVTAQEFKVQIWNINNPFLKDLYLWHEGPPISSAPTVTGSTDGVVTQLSWEPVAYAQLYRVYRDGIQIAEVKTTGFEEAAKTKSHNYQVSAINISGEGPRSEVFTIAPTMINWARKDTGGTWNASRWYSSAEGPGYAFDENLDTFWGAGGSNPAYLYRTLVEPKKISLMQFDFTRVTEATGTVKAYYKDSNEQWVLVGTESKQLPCIIDIECDITAQEFKFEITNLGSVFCREARLFEYIRLLDTPEVTISKTTDRTVAIGWVLVEGAEYYKVYCDGILIGTTAECCYTNSGLVPNTTYSYEVTAVSNEGESDRSTPVQAITTAPQYLPGAKIWTKQPNVLWTQRGKTNVAKIVPEDPIQTPEEPINWALTEHGGTWSATGYCLAGETPDKAFDGDKKTIWSSGDYVPNTVYRTLLEPKHITHIRVYWHPHSNTQTRWWTIQYKDTNGQWQTIDQDSRYGTKDDTVIIACDVTAKEFSITVDQSVDTSNFAEFELWSIPPK